MVETMAKQHAVCVQHGTADHSAVQAYRQTDRHIHIKLHDNDDDVDDDGREIS